MDMLGFDGCCCSCLQWAEPFASSESLTDNWEVETGDWSMIPKTQYTSNQGLYTASASASIKCKRTCSDALVYASVGIAYDQPFVPLATGDPFAFGIAVGGWQSVTTPIHSALYHPFQRLIDPAGSTVSTAYIFHNLDFLGTVGVYAVSLTSSLLADGTNVSNRAGYAPGTPDDNEIRLTVSNPNGILFHFNWFHLYRKETNAVQCLDYSLCANRLVPTAMQVAIQGIENKSSNCAQYNGTYILPQLIGDSSSSGTCTWCRTDDDGVVAYNPKLLISASGTATLVLYSGDVVQWIGELGSSVDLRSLSGVSLPRDPNNLDMFCGTANSSCSLTAIP